MLETLAILINTHRKIVKILSVQIISRKDYFIRHSDENQNPVSLSFQRKLES
jgi:hypothetical protein